MNNDLRMCPQCGSCAVDFSELVGGTARCRGCRWSGSPEDLLTIPAGVGAVGEDAVRSMINELRNHLSGSFGLLWLKFLTKWGFVSGDMNDPVGTVDRKVFARYLSVICRSTLAAILAERNSIEAEKSEASAGVH